MQSAERFGRLRAAITRIKISKTAPGPSTALPGAISRIRAVYASSIHAMTAPTARRLARFYLDGIPTPVLSVCGHGTQEVRFTRYLAYFLDPTRPHGLGPSLLREVLRGFLPDDHLADLDRAEVIPEIWLGDIEGRKGRISCYCDIGIVTPRLLVLMEHKILSGQSTHSDTGVGQLARYDQALAEGPMLGGRETLKLLLSPGASTPKDSEWLPLSHEDLAQRAAGLLDQPEYLWSPGRTFADCSSICSLVPISNPRMRPLCS